MLRRALGWLILGLVALLPATAGPSLRAAAVAPGEFAPPPTYTGTFEFVRSDPFAQYEGTATDVVFELLGDGSAPPYEYRAVSGTASFSLHVPQCPSEVQVNNVQLNEYVTGETLSAPHFIIEDDGGTLRYSGGIRRDVLHVFQNCPGYGLAPVFWNTGPSLPLPDNPATITGSYATGLSFEDVVYEWTLVGDLPGTEFVVNSTKQEFDEDQADGECDTGGTVTRDGEDEPECTLQAAIEQANSAVNPGKDTITFNIPGPGPHSIFGLDEEITQPVIIDASTQPGAATAGSGPIPAPRVEVQSDAVSLPGCCDIFIVDASDTVIRGLSIHSVGGDEHESSGAGIRIMPGVTGVLIEHNYIGVVSGQTDEAAPNEYAGVVVDGAHGNVIRENVIRGNGWGEPDLNELHEGPDGDWGDVVITNGGSGNVITGNMLGPGGVYSDPDFLDVRMRPALLINGPGNTVGGPAAADRNIIQGTVEVNSQGNVLAGNWFGIQEDGQTQTEPRGADVFLSGGNTFGGPAPGDGNVIAGEVHIFGDDGVARMEGNLLGTPNGVDPFSGPNYVAQFWGVTVDGSEGAVIVGNTIAHYEQAGIRLIDSSGSLIANNTIHANGTGIEVREPDFLQVGVAIRNKISANSIFDNAFLGIDLGADGVTPNDSDDNDNGPNTLLNFPIITEVRATLAPALISFGSTSYNPGAYTFEIFASPDCDASGNGEGKHLIHTVTTNTVNGPVNIVDEPIPGLLLAGTRFLTITATDQDGNTSEFSRCAEIAEVAGILDGSPLEGDTSITVTIQPGNSSVQSTSPAFAPGDTIVINAWPGEDGPDTTETNRVASVSQSVASGGGMTITIEWPLRFAHPAGTMVIVTAPGPASGDADCSGEVDMEDLVALMRHSGGLGTFAGCLYDAGDVNCDGVRDGRDTLPLLRHIAGVPGASAGCRPIGV